MVRFKEDILEILKALIKMKDDKVESLFIDRGLILFMLNLIFTKE